MFYLQSLATCSALTWLLFRAWQTLWKPVPELINILGVEVPDAPNVSLTSVKADNVTIHWQPPDPSKPVQSYFIQVNGVKGEDRAASEKREGLTGCSWRAIRREKPRLSHQRGRFETRTLLQH
jgi:hypothetical protein